VGGYVLRRLWQTIPVLFGVSLLAFPSILLAIASWPRSVPAWST
jgi:ABC-type dipeptide/oligopeptide/nickel transport system permease component